MESGKRPSFAAAKKIWDENHGFAQSAILSSVLNMLYQEQMKNKEVERKCQVMKKEFDEEKQKLLSLAYKINESKLEIQAPNLEAPPPKLEIPAAQSKKNVYYQLR